MTPDTPRLLFALLCILCAVGIVTGAFLEIMRMRRGDSVLAPWHFRLRLMSAVIWVIILFAVTCLATTLWPGNIHTKQDAVRSGNVLAGVLCLIVVALFLLAGDMWFLSRARRRIERQQAIRFSEQLHELAETESARLRAQQSQKAGSASVPGERMPNGIAPDGISANGPGPLNSSDE